MLYEKRSLFHKHRMLKPKAAQFSSEIFSHSADQNKAPYINPQPKSCEIHPTSQAFNSTCHKVAILLFILFSNTFVYFVRFLIIEWRHFCILWYLLEIDRYIDMADIWVSPIYRYRPCNWPQ